MLEGIVPDLSFLTGALLVEYSVLAIEVSVVVIILGLIVIVLARRRSLEERHAVKVLSSVEKLRQGKFVSKSSEKASVSKSSNGRAHKDSSDKKLVISKAETSLKDMLVKKFKPKIESQLNTKVVIIDFNAQNENFLALVEISGVKLLLTLDSSGKIIDYKKVKQNQ